jgi:hypothetical protein
LIVLHTDFNREVRTSEFTQSAAYAFLLPGSKNLVGFIQFQDLFGAKMDTYPATLTPFPVYDVFFEYWFIHS